jgi:acyl dehydratase
MGSRRGLYWDEFKIGDVFESGGRTITEGDITAFAALSGDWNPLHCDAEFAKTTPFGQRIAHGLLGLTVASGLGDREGILEGTLLAFLGLEWNFKGPIFIGDTIHQRRTVIEKTESKQMERGIMKFKVEILNQKNEVVQEGVRTLLMRRRG